MRVILDVFSGRKNPSWRLDEKNARELVERVKSFPPYSEALSAHSQLGLRNVILELEPGESQGYALPAQVAFGVDDLPSLTRRVAVDSLKQQTATSIKRQTVEWL